MDGCSLDHELNCGACRSPRNQRLGMMLKADACNHLQDRSEPMKDDFGSLFAFNRWANARMLDACRKLTPEQYAAEPVPGWSSVRATVCHIAVVTELWL